MPSRGRRKGKVVRARGRGERLVLSSVHGMYRTAQRYHDAKEQNGPVRVLVKDGRPVIDQDGEGQDGGEIRGGHETAASSPSDRQDGKIEAGTETKVKAD